MSENLAALRSSLLAACREIEPVLPLPGFNDQLKVELFLSRRCPQALHEDATVAAWVARQRACPRLQAKPTRLDQLAHWNIDPESGNIVHESGYFFSVTGLKVRHRIGNRAIVWDQPIIDQPEVGILGILATPIDGILHFCLQAKEEPGNIGGNQLSPTVQATFSNYSGVHGGGAPPFVEHFLAPPPERVLFARLQTEDGGRFLYKSNRNLIILLPPEEQNSLPDGFIWLTLRQIAELMQQDNLVHATTRSILAALLGCGHEPAFLSRIGASLPTTASSEPPPATHSLADQIQWVDDHKAFNHMLVRRTGIKTLDEWAYDRDGFLSHRDERFFRIIGIDVSGADREVHAWSQPILCNPERGIIGLLVKEAGGRRFFLMQAKAEVGNRNTVQLAPTVQFTPGNYDRNLKLEKPFLFDAFSGHCGYASCWENLQSEEGARFYHESHRHRILHLPPGQELSLPADFHWFSEEQLRFFLHFGDLVNSCARSVLACLL